MFCAISSAGWPGRIRDTPPFDDAADVLRAVGHDHQAVVAGLHRRLGLDQLSRGRERQHVVVADVDDDNVALRIEGDAVRLTERRALNRGLRRCRRALSSRPARWPGPASAPPVPVFVA